MEELSKIKTKIRNIMLTKKYKEESIENIHIIIDNVYNILKAYTYKKDTEIIENCNDAFIYYIEFIKQLKDNNNINIQFTNVDISTFIYNKILKDVIIEE